MQAIQAIRGMNDLLPDQIEWWQRVEEKARNILASFGYREIRTPVVEKLDLCTQHRGKHRYRRKGNVCVS
jgi:histidyl-tRNA synthetase